MWTAFLMLTITNQHTFYSVNTGETPKTNGQFAGSCFFPFKEMNLKKTAITLNAWFSKQYTPYIKIEEPLDGIWIPQRRWLFKQRDVLDVSGWHTHTVRFRSSKSGSSFVGTNSRNLILLCDFFEEQKQRSLLAIIICFNIIPSNLVIINGT